MVPVCPSEDEYWYGFNNSNNGNFPKQPFASGSGLVMILFACVGMRHRDIELPLEFWLSQASLVACGVGTFVFHGVSDSKSKTIRINTIMWDGVTMTLLLSSLMLLFAKQNQRQRVAYFVVVDICWAAYSNDAFVFDYLLDWTSGWISYGVQYPLFILPYSCILCYSVRYIVSNKLPLTLSILCALISWIIDKFVCFGLQWIGHSVWHVAIGYNIFLLIHAGLQKRRYEVTGAWWPVVVTKQEPVEFDEVITV